MKAICDIPLAAIEAVEIYLNQFRHSIAQVAAQAQAGVQDLCGHRRDVER